MRLTVNQHRKIEQAVTIVLLGTLVGPFYVMLADGFDHLYPFINGLVVCSILGTVVAVLELWVFTGQVRRKRFIVLFLFRIIGYLLLITVVTFNVFLISRMRRFELTYAEVWQSEEFQNYIFGGKYYVVLLVAFVIIAGLNFTRQLSRKLGQGMLMAYLSGRYRTPRREERIFMLLNLQSSHLIAEKLEGLEFHNLLNDFFYDITESIVVHSGIITQYVEDEVMVTWSMRKGLTNANCVRTFFQLRGELAALNEEYFEKYGVIPKVKAALHCGPIIRAEIGEVKSEVSFFGDTINTTARILEECHAADTDVLASSELMRHVQLPVLYRREEFGKTPLRGKEAIIDLFSITEVDHE